MEIFSKFNDKQIKNLMANYQRQGQTSASYYHELLEENSRRSGNGLNFETTLVAVKLAARERRFLSYQELAEKSGCPFNKVRFAINPHLQGLLEYCHARGIPLLSAIVVNKQNAATGKLDKSALSGFVKGVEELGISIDDPDGFLRAEQERIFSWADEF
jgi:hypothetical protein